jgi:hypothetical protein
MITRLKKLTIYSLLTLGILPATLLAKPPNPSNGDETETKSEKTIFQDLNQTDLLEITIETDLTELIENRYRDEYQPATISYKDNDGAEVNYEIKLRPRGKFRRKTCDFPPVKIKFPKKQIMSEGYAEHNDFKLVTHCLDSKFEGNENVMKEFLGYKIFNELTDKSFRVQAVRIVYKDTAGKYGKKKRYGFLIEDTDEMAERLGGEVCECMNTDKSKLHQEAENLMSVFQYMIGNADWDEAMSRNLKMVQTPDGTIIPVPYDFDFSGLVNAEYARPNPDYGMTAVTDRVFLGQKTESQILGSNIFLLKQKKKDIYKLVRTFKHLSIEGKEGIIQYLDSFYDNISELGYINATKEEVPRVHPEEYDQMK